MNMSISVDRAVGLEGNTADFYLNQIKERKMRIVLLKKVISPKGSACPTWPRM